MKQFTIGKYTFRIKKMNAIELLALRSVINFKSVKSALDSYDALLERVEVNIKDNDWLQVKQGQAYYPVNIENDVAAIEICIANMLDYVREVFQKSDGSNNEQE